MSDVMVLRNPEHALASPSMFEAIKLCPYTALCRVGWDEGESPSAKRGHKLHKAVYDDATYNSIEDEDDKALIDMIRTYIVKPCEVFERHFELRLTLQDEEGRERTFGTADFIAVNTAEQEAQLIDWKFGTHPVPVAKNNLQIRCYVAMAFQRFPEVKTIHAMIVQPALGQVNYETMTTFSRAVDYPVLLKEALEICESAETATPESAKPDPEACRWCNKMGCPAYKNTMMIALRDWCDNAPMPGEAPQGAPPPEVVEFCDGGLEQLALIKNLVAQKEEPMKRAIVAAGGSEHYRVNNARITKVVDWKAVCAECGVPQEVIDKHTLEKIGEPYAVRKRH